MINTAYSYFPSGTIHVIVVDPGVGGNRAIVALEMSGYRFLAPDNGILTLLLQQNRIDRIVRVDQRRYFRNPVSRTFHGRDIFAPVAGQLSMNLALADIGTPVRPASLVQLDLSNPYRSTDGKLIGKVVYIDHFGNIITNISQYELDQFNPNRIGGRLRIRIGQHQIDRLSETYESQKTNTPLALINSSGYLEIALKNGNASQFLGVGPETLIQLG
jgi:S-adenosylmethionine hydrolase